MAELIRWRITLCCSLNRSSCCASLVRMAVRSSIARRAMLRLTMISCPVVLRCFVAFGMSSTPSSPRSTSTVRSQRSTSEVRSTMNWKSSVIGLCARSAGPSRSMPSKNCAMR